MADEFHFVKEQSAYKTIRQVAFAYPKRTALIYQNHKISYTKFLFRINQFANSLRIMGYKKGDIITICLPNVPDAIYLVYGANQLGCICNILHPLLNVFQIRETMMTTKSNILFCLDTKYKDFKELENDGINIKVCSPTHGLFLLEKIVYNLSNRKKIGKIPRSRCIHYFYKVRRWFKYDKNYLDDAFYLNSGGTSGKAKMIALSNFALNSLSSNVPWIANSNDFKNKGMLAVLPMFHGFGLGVGVHFLISFGGMDVLMPKFDRNLTIKYIRKGYIKYMIGIPILYEGLLSKKSFSGKKLKSLSIAFVGGDFVRSSLLARFNERMVEAGSSCRLMEGYGLTETVCVCSVNTPEHNKAGTSGIALPNVKFKIVNPETLEELKPNEEGEVLVSGETLMNGYVFSDDLQANEKTFVMIDGVKWLRTGDFCSLSEDNFIIFKQRIKSIVKVSGVPVFPSMIEDCVSSYNFIYECCAKGIEDEKHGHIIKLFVVLNRAYKGSIEDAKKLILDKIIRELGIYSKPKEIVFMNELPHTTVGKIDAKVLK